MRTVGDTCLAGTTIEVVLRKYFRDSPTCPIFGPPSRLFTRDYVKYFSTERTARRSCANTRSAEEPLPAMVGRSRAPTEHVLPQFQHDPRHDRDQGCALQTARRPGWQTFRARLGEPRQRADGLLEHFVALDIVAEPGDVGGVLPEDFGDRLATVLAEGHHEFGHIPFIGLDGEFWACGSSSRPLARGDDGGHYDRSPNASSIAL